MFINRFIIMKINYMFKSDNTYLELQILIIIFNRFLVKSKIV